jgi:hypothetical protein
MHKPSNPANRWFGHGYRVGARLEVCALLCTRVSRYEVTNGIAAGSTRWRYTWEGPNGERFVYSGINIGVREGAYINATVTIKALDSEWKCIRVMRVKVTRRFQELPTSLV